MANKEIDELSGIETTGHEWDGLKELNNPLPKWWVWTLYATIIWSIGYILLYPALPWFGGPTKGLLDWSSRGAVRQELKAARAEQQTLWDRIETADLAEIRADPKLLEFAMASGKAAFGDNCAPCHGSGAAGLTGYPNLNDDDWLWGGTLEDIKTTISVGVRAVHDETRDNAMPAFGRDGILDKQQILDVAGFVRALSGQATKGANLDDGAIIYAEQCVSCHGEDGRGNQELGAPNLANGIWLYGGGTQDVVVSIASSRNGVMPSWDGRVEPTVIKALTVYVHSLGGGL